MGERRQNHPRYLIRPERTYMRGTHGTIYGFYVLVLALIISCGGSSACNTYRADAEATRTLAHEYKAEATKAQNLAAQYETERDWLASEVESLTGEVESLTAAISAVNEDNDALKAQLREATRPKPTPKPTAAPEPSRSAEGWSRAKASWYGPGLYGNKTADGTVYTPETWCVAHKSLPMGTMVEFKYNGKTVKVPVKDRGPFTPGREWDLSNAVRLALGFNGVQTVEYRVVR